MDTNVKQDIEHDNLLTKTEGPDYKLKVTSEPGNSSDSDNPRDSLGLEDFEKVDMDIEDTKLMTQPNLEPASTHTTYDSNLSTGIDLLGDGGPIAPAALDPFLPADDPVGVPQHDTGKSDEGSTYSGTEFSGVDGVTAPLVEPHISMGGDFAHGVPPQTGVESSLEFSSSSGVVLTESSFGDLTPDPFAGDPVGVPISTPATAKPHDEEKVFGAPVSSAEFSGLHMDAEHPPHRDILPQGGEPSPVAQDLEYSLKEGVSPRQPSPSPKEQTPPPKEPSPSPREPTPPPKEQSPPPKEPTPPPKEQSPPPREPTPPLREPTPPPREPTPPPREPTPPPREQILPYSVSPVVSSPPDSSTHRPLQEPTVSEGKPFAKRKYQGEMSDSLKKSLAVFQPFVNLIYWRDVKKSGAVFGSIMVILLSLTYFSLISVVAYSSLAVLSGTIAFRIYMNVMQAINKSQDGHPFKKYLELDTNLQPDKVHEAADVFVSQANSTISELKRLFLAEDLIDSFKFGCLLWCLTYLGSWFNGLTLVTLSVVALFTLPKVYEQNQALIDQYCGVVCTHFNEIVTKVKSAIPIGNKENKEKEQ